MSDSAQAAAAEIEKLIRIQIRNSYRDSLRPAQWQALRYFASAPSGKRSLSHFARHRRSTMGTASMTVSQLVQRGFLERSDPDGQRNIGLRLTDRGWRTLENDPIEDLVSALRNRDECDRRWLCDLLRALNTELEAPATGDDPPADG